MVSPQMPFLLPWTKCDCNGTHVEAAQFSEHGNKTVFVGGQGASLSKFALLVPCSCDRHSVHMETRDAGGRPPRRPGLSAN
jgi:hypothetical protein